MYCKKCGTEQRKGHKFCPKCGMPFIVNDPMSNNIKKSDIFNEELIDSSVITVMDSQNEDLVKEQPVLSNTQGDAFTDNNSDPKKKGNTTIDNNKKQKIDNKQSNDSELNIINAGDNANFGFWGWVSIIGIVIYSFFVFTNNSEDTAHYSVIFCVIAMINPIYTLYNIVKDNKEEKLDLSIAVIISILLCVIMAIVGFMTKEEKYGLFVDFLAKLTSLPFQYVYFILIIIANATIKSKVLCLYSTAVVVGMLTPIALAVAIYIVLIVIALAICFIFGNSSKGTLSSSSSSSSSLTLQNSNKDNVPKEKNLYDPNIRDFYIVYRDGPYGPYDCIKRYPKNVDPSRILRDLKKEHSNAVSLVDYHIHDSLHDSTLNYK